MTTFDLLNAINNLRKRAEMYKLPQPYIDAVKRCEDDIAARVPLAQVLGTDPKPRPKPKTKGK